MFVEKRKSPRVSSNLPIKISYSDFDMVTETKNISSNGAYCAVNKDIPTMTKLKIILLIPLRKNNKKSLKRINCEGIVVRKEYIKTNNKYNYRIGIYFNELREADRKNISSYINSYLDN